jgi:hypothetical protein
MSQETNLNISPYFDDFDANKNYYKVLFKPGFPVQARELNTLQSIAQYQTEQFGKHIFKEGSVVIPGQLRYENPLYAVEIEPEYNGTPISLYFSNLLGAKIRGQSSRVSAEIVYLLTDIESERSNYTLYVKYIESGGDDFDRKVFFDSETLILETPVSYSNTTIQVGQGFCNTKFENAVSEGSAVSVAKGIYFVRGIFANVSNQTIILDQYSVSPSYKVGFNVLETIISSDDDESLFDNAQGFTNFSAPGADRFKLELQLGKRDLTDNDTDNFVEILRVNNGIPQFFNKNAQYNLLREELARRTFDESGNYFVKPFSLFVRDSLNDRTRSQGMFFDTQTTPSGNDPSEDLMIYQIGPGKAYVSGYDVEVISSRLLDVKKPRDTQEITDAVVSYNSGSLCIVNNAYGAVLSGLGTDSSVSLMDSRLNGVEDSVAAGTTIGVARVYDFIPETDYVDETSRLQLRLFDIQTYTKITLTANITLNTPAQIKGNRSKAIGYLVENVTDSKELTLYDVNGEFLNNETISINGIDNTRLISAIKDYDVRDIKSIYSDDNGVDQFNGDLVLDKKFYISRPGTVFKITDGTSGSSVVSAGLENTFINLIRVGDIITYTGTSFTDDPVYNQVTAVSAGGTNFTVKAVTSIPKICDGSLPTADIEVSNIIRIQSSINTKNSSLLTRLPSDNVSSLNFGGNEVLQRRTFKGVSFSNNSITLTIPAEDVDIFFAAFDEDRFVIAYDDGNGTIEPMRRDKYYLDPNGGGKTLTFNGLEINSGTADVIVTVRNTTPSSKIKRLNKTNTLIISNSSSTASGIGSTTLNDGLTYSNLYGTRVQDDEICLNVPDIVRVIAVYESLDTSDPVLPNCILNSFTGPLNNTSDFKLGETIVGKTSGASAIIVRIINATTIEYVGLNPYPFAVNEVISGNQTKTEAIISNIGNSSKNITKNYSLDDGQRETFYDYGRIIRKQNTSKKKKKIKVVFQNYTIDSSDTGEFITANSYSLSDFKYDVPFYRNSRLSDFVDIRPRVAPYSANNNSPFEFNSRTFDSDGQYSEYILVPDENLIANYSFYLGRIDRVFLNPNGTFEVSQGKSSIAPIPPPLKENSIDIATIYLPPYLYNTKSVNVDMSVHKRYRMSDISLLEDRIKRVEKYTTLTMLESQTENYQIKDAETGLDRFKCGFFVDNFTSHKYHDLKNFSFRSAIDTSTKTLRPKHYTTSIDLQLGSEAIEGVTSEFNASVDQSYVTDLGSAGIRKTGDLITLNYNEVVYYDQPYATTTESVTPFLVRYWSGFIQLNPPSDNWVEERIISTTSTIDNTQTTIIPDENITIIDDVFIENIGVYVDDPISQVSANAFDWIETAKSILSGITEIGGIKVRIDSSGKEANELGLIQSNGFINDTTLHLEVRNSSVTDVDRELIRQLLPPDVANDYINQIDNSNLIRTVLEFNATEYFSGGTVEEVVTTTTNTTTNTETIIIPEEIIVTETTSTETVSNYDEPIRFLRSRNIEFDVKGLKPVTRFYPFFEGIDVANYIVPKLLEVNMISGKFQIGETVESDPFFTGAKIVFRLCKPNHRTGPFDGSNPPEITNPVPILDFTTGQVTVSEQTTSNSLDVYKINPYNQGTFQPEYSESSTFLNVDTRSLQLPSEVDFYGVVKSGMRLIGRTSGAVAEISNIRLVSDNSGRLIGSLFIPDPTIVGNPQWINGTNTFTVIDTNSLSNLNQVYDEFIANSRVNESSAEKDFESSGLANIEEINITTTRNIEIIPSYNINTTTITNTTTTTTTFEETGGDGGVTIWETTDPLAQSFYVRDESGIFLTSCDVFFETKDDSIPVTIQIRPMVAGVPSTMVIPFGEITLSPDQINVSTDGSVATKVRFPSPIYLNGPRNLNIRSSPVGSVQSAEYAIVLLSNSPNYRVFISELGQNDLLTGIKLSQQYTLGSLFKSQNGSTWSPAQLEDLKYKIYRADFETEGIVRYFNPKLSNGNGKICVTGPNQFRPLSKKSLVGLGSTGFDQENVIPGVSLIQGSATGTLTGIAGSVLTLDIVNPGTGYTAGTYNNVTLTSETGFGEDLTADILISGIGTIQTVTVVTGGYGYQVGDSIIVPESEESLNVGFGGKLVVSELANQNAFVIDNIQGSFDDPTYVGITTISYIDVLGDTVEVGAGVTANPNTIIDDQYYDGIHMKVYHPNHGMHSSENFVKISKFRPPDTDEYQLTTAIIETSTNLPDIVVTDSSVFGTFEGSSVSGGNPGYIIIGNEVMKYNSIANNTINITERNVGGTETDRSPIPLGARIYKYEFNGISLNRINNTHSFGIVDQSIHPVTLDSYHIKIENSNQNFLETLQTGNKGTNISQNIQFEVMTPNVSTIIPSGTDIQSRVRTFTGQSVGGNENSFEDDGFRDVELNKINKFNSPRLICSVENEERLITTSPGSKSFELDMILTSQDSRVSPVIDTASVSVILTTNLINNPMGILENSNYADNDRVRSLNNDPHSTIYISKPVRLKIPANSLNVILSAKRNNLNDVRVLYQLYRADSPNISSHYELFPGYSNYQIDGRGIKRVIDSSQNDGSQDSDIKQTSEYKFRDYVYSVDDLPDFDAFSIKIVMASENQATPPLIKDLRAIATTRPRA